LIVETSPDNFQAWLNHGRSLPKETSTVAARTLAEKFGGDPGSADWRHFGRLAAFTNRKPRYEVGGRYPYVRLVHSTGQTYENASEFISEVEKQVEAKRMESERRREWFSKNAIPERLVVAKDIDSFRRDDRYASDGNRIDLAYAVYALSHGGSEDDVRRAIAGRDLSHKGSPNRQADYIERTVRKAMQTVQAKDRCR
jgi:hypothetical protein